MTDPKRIVLPAAIAAALASAACSRGPEPSTLHLAPSALAEAAAPPRPAPAPAASSPAKAAPDDPPTPADVAEFERSVPK